MNLHDELASLPVHKKADHKNALQAALLSNMTLPDGKKQKSYKKLLLGFGLAPVAAVALFVGMMFWKPVDNTTPNIIQQAAAPLTAKQIFALAEQQIIDPNELKPGEYYYKKARTWHVSWITRTECYATNALEETYLNSDGVEVMRLSSTVDGKLSNLSTVSEDGLKAGNMFFFDKTVDAAKRSPAPCPEVPVSENTGEVSPADIEAERKDPIFIATQSLYLGVPAKQKTALQTLQSSTEFTTTEHVQIAEYPKPVVVIQEKTAKPGDAKYYFDQQTKQLVGVKNYNQWFIVLQQDVRELPAYPQYTTPPPPQL